LEDLLTAVFIAHTKVLTAIRLTSNNKKIEITIPKVEHFLFKVLCEISKLLWSSTYLFRQDISGIDQQQNYKSIEGVINEGIIQAIRSLVPVKSIVKNLVNQDEKDDKDLKDVKDLKDDDSDEDDVQIGSAVTEPAVTEPAITEPSVTEPSVTESANPVQDSIIHDESSADSTADSMPLVDLESSEDVIEPESTSAPTIINLDEKPKVSFASFNSLFSSEDPDKSNMVSAHNVGQNAAPDLEILEQSGSSLTNDDFDDLNDQDSAVDGYEELS
jgi:hypothetical protein